MRGYHKQPGFTRSQATGVKWSKPQITGLLQCANQESNSEDVPNAWIVESKSLKLYLLGYRNHGAFHEACTVGIAKHLMELMSPRWLRIGGYWYPRGGIPIDVFWQSGAPLADVWLPDQGVATYRGRG